MARLEFQIDNLKHRVVYIDYAGKIPHSVTTMAFIETAVEPYWRTFDWWCFANNGDIEDIQLYNAGSGGSPLELQEPTWIDGYTGRYWLSNEAKFRGTPVNAKRLKHPKIITNSFGEKSRNPFKVADITPWLDYCDRCGHDSNDFCSEHKYIDDEGNERYIDDDSEA